MEGLRTRQTQRSDMTISLIIAIIGAIVYIIGNRNDTTAETD